MKNILFNFESNNSILLNLIKLIFLIIYFNILLIKFLKLSIFILNVI